MHCVTCREAVTIDVGPSGYFATCEKCGPYKIEKPSLEEKLSAFKSVCSRALKDVVRTSDVSAARYKYINDALELEYPLNVSLEFQNALEGYTSLIMAAMDEVGDEEMRTGATDLFATIEKKIVAMMEDQAMIMEAAHRLTGKAIPDDCF